MQITISPQDFREFERLCNSLAITPISVKTKGSKKAIPWHKFIETQNRDIQQEQNNMELPQEPKPYFDPLKLKVKESLRASIKITEGRVDFNFGCDTLDDIRYIFGRFVGIIDDMKVEQDSDWPPF